MADYSIVKKSKEILRQFSITEKSNILLCPILKVLQMRHANLDMVQVTRVVRRVLDE